ncbi:MAG: hypothetical protein ACFB2W_04830 [Leptolyngbyaceae cyanobacterium]
MAVLARCDRNPHLNDATYITAGFSQFFNINDGDPKEFDQRSDDKQQGQPQSSCP